MPGHVLPCATLGTHAGKLSRGRAPSGVSCYDLMQPILEDPEAQVKRLFERL